MQPHDPLVRALLLLARFALVPDGIVDSFDHKSGAGSECEKWWKRWERAIFGGLRAVRVMSDHDMTLRWRLRLSPPRTRTRLLRTSPARLASTWGHCVLNHNNGPKLRRKGRD